MRTHSLLFSTITIAAVLASCSQAKDSRDDPDATGGTGAGASGGAAGTGGAGAMGGSAGSAGSGGAGATGGAAGSGAGGSGGDSGTGGTAGSGGSGGGTGGSAGTGGTGGAPTSCSTGRLRVGDPLYNDKPDVGAPKPAGQGVLDDPPIRNEAIAVIGTKLFVETEFDVWSTDLAAATPTISRFAGREGDAYINAGVPCAETRFLVVRDMVASPDGKLVLCDYVGGAIVEITDPAGPNCRSHWVAGTNTRTDDPGDEYPLAKGDRDGPGAQALFGGTAEDGAGIRHLAVDPAGNIYTRDDGTGKFKKIATDSARTVSTIGRGLRGDNVMALAFLNGKLYATGVDGTNDFLLEIDPATYDAANPTANVKEVFRARDHFDDVPSGSQGVPGSMVSDGQALIISAQSGWVWRVATDGTVLATLAGTGRRLDYTNDFDPLVPHPANEWQLLYFASNSNGGPWLTLSAGKLYWSGGFGIGKHILEFSCP
jgi:hypothetical protein